ncbi:hypothetical protein C8P63_102118 [Melghirimyces profundicolus]|uniref:Uncharacterized protein n=1 Tax=Melghirimyces profundicolus TaxID=1242148 RepID=A0A2T6C8H5_9BACL|nr:hypothetical protein C8P63_102118 [Melghirimyces profundicolus]
MDPFCSGQFHKLTEEFPGSGDIQTVNGVGRFTHGITRDGYTRNNIGFFGTGTKEVGAAGIAITGTTVSGGIILRKTEPAVIKRFKLGDGFPAFPVVGESGTAGLIYRGMNTVTDSGEGLTFHSVVVAHPVKQTCFRQLGRLDFFNGLIQQYHRQVGGVGLTLVVVWMSNGFA